MDSDVHGLRDFAKMCAQQAQSELKEPDRVPVKKCIQIPRLMLRRPGETYREQIALANVSIARHMTARPKWSATRRGISDDSQDGMLLSMVNVDPLVAGDTQRSRRESRGVSETTCKEQMQNEAFKLARSGAEPSAALPNSLLRGPGQIFGEGKVAAAQQHKMALSHVASQPTDLPAPKALSVVPKGKVKGLAAMWEKKQVSASVAPRDAGITKPTACKVNKFVERFWKDLPENAADYTDMYAQVSKQAGHIANAHFLRGKTTAPHVAPAEVKQSMADAKLDVSLGAFREKVAAGEVAQTRNLCNTQKLRNTCAAMQRSTPETCATPLRVRRSTGATPLRACLSTA